MFSDSFSARLERVRKDLGKSIEWAVINAFVTDILAMKSIGVDTPLIQKDYLALFKLITDTEFNISTKKKLKNQELQDFPKGVAAENIVNFLNNAFNANDKSWDEIIELRKKKGKKIRTWLEKSIPKSSRASLSEVAIENTAKIYTNATRAINTMGLGFSGAVLFPFVKQGIIQFDAKTITLLLGAIARFRYRANLIKGFARFFEKGRSNEILIDTNFFFQLNQ